jgi:hypothetical protein
MGGGPFPMGTIIFSKIFAVSIFFFHSLARICRGGGGGSEKFFSGLRNFFWTKKKKASKKFFRTTISLVKV